MATEAQRTDSHGSNGSIDTNKVNHAPLDMISLRGVEVHNLRQIDLDLPHNQLIAICGVSGSGKTSLALDTIYAEGQRRYIESFSAYTRQFLDRLEKPAAERIDGITPAVAVTRKTHSRSSRSTIGTATESADYLRLLFAKIGNVHCPACEKEIRKDSPQSVAKWLTGVPQDTRFMIGAELQIDDDEELELTAKYLLEEGFVRVVVEGTTYSLAEHFEAILENHATAKSVVVIIDRLKADWSEPNNDCEIRSRDSLETAFSIPDSVCVVFAPSIAGDSSPIEVDGRDWTVSRFSARHWCESCDLEFPAPEPRLFSFNSPMGACPECEGFGNIIDIDMELIVPNPNKTIREGAIAPWNTPAYEHELQELLALAGDYDLPVDIPFSELKPKHLKLIHDGVKERKFGGLSGFFAWLERRKYKMHLRVFLSRWRSYKPCHVCDGNRLRDEALSVRIGPHNIAEVCQMKISQAKDFFDTLELSQWESEVSRFIIEQLRARLYYLSAVGLGYLTLDRTLRTLSGGEAQRVNLTTALGSSLVNMLYVLDEPTVGLHPRDVDQLTDAIVGLRDRGNTVVVVEHEDAMLRAADRLIEIGPGAGNRGGQVVFEGTLEEAQSDNDCVTGDYLSGKRRVPMPSSRRPTSHGWIRLTNATGNNLKNIDVEFPLGVLCLVTGVSGSGKSTLVQDTLYGAVCQRKRKDSNKPHPFDDVFGDGQIDDVVLVDQSPIGKSPRSNPVTYIKAFDQIRAVFAETVDARTHNYTAGHFSFNVDGGRCETCKGDGHIEIDMQFLADVYMKCHACGGRRYRDEILRVTYRGKNIADVLDMTIREAFSFFRGQPKVQTKLKRLIDVGLDYLRLGQPANTLSSGESQRLKLAAYMSAAKRHRTLFILDEPTTGLHFSDIVQLIDCFDALISVGHSLIVVEHNPQLMQVADYIIDLGPGASDEGGQVVTQGTPEEVAEVAESYTGQHLKMCLENRLAHEQDYAT